MRRFLLLPVLLLAPAASAQDLTTTIADALNHSPSLAQAQSEEAVAKARFDAARAERNPQASVQGQIGYGRIDNGGFFGIGPKNITPLAVQVGAEMPLFTGGRLAAAQDQARGGVELATLGMADARSRIMVGAVAAYAEVLTARQIEARFRQLTGELAEVERQAGLRFTAGEIPASERPMPKVAVSAQRRNICALPAMRQGNWLRCPPCPKCLLRWTRPSTPRIAPIRHWRRLKRASTSPKQANVPPKPMPCPHSAPLPKPATHATSSSPIIAPMR
jgi:hypothetical protein